MFLYPCFFLSIKLRLIACPIIWNIEQEKDREKEIIKLNKLAGQRSSTKKRASEI